jgi:hypothetical protein
MTNATRSMLEMLGDAQERAEEAGRGLRFREIYQRYRATLSVREAAQAALKACGLE